jgi:putative phosphoesterase
MKIAVISDTHDNLRVLDKALHYFKNQGIELIIHCGDWDMPFVMRIFAKFNIPIKGVLGNGDPDIQKYQYQMQNLPVLKNLKLDLSARMQDFSVDGKRIAVFHGDDPHVKYLIIESQLYDVFCVGHNHESSIEKKGKTLVINPGTFIGYSIEKGIVPATAAIYDTQTNEAQMIDIDKI